MKARPIIFSGEMVRALLDGRKTQTRRVVKPQPLEHDGMNCRRLKWFDRKNRMVMDEAIDPLPPCGQIAISFCPFGQPGDLLWVRETWATYADDQVEYLASPLCGGDPDAGWRPSIHMPRWASRLTLQLTDVRIQRVAEIGQGDACEEGRPAGIEPIGWFQELWDSLNAKRGYDWDANPWVWVLEFHVIEANVDDVLAAPEQHGIREAA